MKFLLNSSFHLYKGYDFSLLKENKKEFKTINIPFFPYINDKENYYVYKKEFTFDEKDKTIYLNIEDTYYPSFVYLNEKLVLITKKVTPLSRIDVTEYLKKNNTLVIFVKNEHKNYFDYSLGDQDNCFYGLNGDIYLEVERKTHIKNINLNYAKYDGSLSFDVEVEKKEEYELSYKLYHESTLVHSFTDNVIQIPFVHPYELDDPFIYDLEVTLKTKTYEDIKSIKIGFKDTTFLKDSFLLNYNKHFLYGLKIVSNKLLSRVENKMVINNLKEFKEAGINLLSLNSTFINNTILNILDEMGIFFILELPNFVDDNYYSKEDYISSVKSYINIVKSHPSLLGYYITTSNKEASLVTYKVIRSYDRVNFITSKLIDDEDNDFIFIDRSYSYVQNNKEIISKHPSIKYFYSSDQTLFSIKDTLNSEIDNCLNYFKTLSKCFEISNVGLMYVSYINKIDSDFTHASKHKFISDFILKGLKINNSNKKDIYVLNPPLKGKSPYSTYDKIVVFSNASSLSLTINDEELGQYKEENFSNLDMKIYFIDNIFKKTYNGLKYSSFENELIADCLENMAKNIGSFSEILSLNTVKILLSKGILKTEELIPFYTKEITSNNQVMKYNFFSKEENISKVYNLSSDINLKVEKEEVIFLNDNFITFKMNIKLVDENDNDITSSDGILELAKKGDITLINNKYEPFELGKQSIYFIANKESDSKVFIKYQGKQLEVDVSIKKEETL